MGNNSELECIQDSSGSYMDTMSTAKDYQLPIIGLNEEKNRLNTFANWPPNAPVSREKLAKAGFYYVGPELNVRCFSCNGTIDNWNFNDQVLQRHQLLNRHCDFINNRSNNVPFVPKPSAALPLVSPHSRNYNFTFTSRDNSFLEGRAELTFTHEKTWSTLAVLRKESERLKTYSGWPLSFIQPAALAKVGFFYLKDGDKVQCFFCKGIVGEWEVDDVPMMEHQRHFPNCAFVRGYDVGNVPIEDTRQVTQQPTQMPPADDVTGRYQYEMEVFSGPEKGHINALNLENCNLGEIGITRHMGPKHPNYATVEARLRSFGSWPESIPQNPEELAIAGFYYVGVSDHVRCFHCDGGLRNWEASDDPWIEHARWFGNCSFVLLVKGTEFVAQAKLLHPPLLNTISVLNQVPCIKKVTLQEIDSLLDSPVVKTVLECGVTLPVIRFALQKQIQTAGEPFATPDALYEACMFAQEELESNYEKQPKRTVSHEQPSVSSSKIMNGIMPSSASEPSLRNLTRKTQELSLAEENQRLKEMQLCKICMDEEVGIVFLPCGHLISCPNCATSISDCPVCRKPIIHVVRTYLS